MSENWRPVISYEDEYSISDHGRVRSERREIIQTNGKLITIKEKILKIQHHYKSGHARVTLHSSDGRATTIAVHRLVLEAFVGPCPVGMETCHWDDNPTNNHLRNLRWGTRSDNKYDLVRNGRWGNATHCKYGHELTSDNTYVYQKRGHVERQCKTCTFDRTYRRRQRLKASA